MYIKGLKYACNSCIKGHRSSSCNHIDRPLFEIRKKGRPVSQCTLCRDLRKTKQVHIKCACTIKKENQPILMNQNTEEQPYSWALITSPIESNSSSDTVGNEKTDDRLGFVFHKPSSTNRILNGEPRIGRGRSSSKKNTSFSKPAQALVGGLTTPPVSRDCPNQQLTQPNTEELSAMILNSMFEPILDTPLTTPDSTPNSFDSTNGSQQAEGESVVITITPLTVKESNTVTTTRIVTCYCGSNCTCPGCLVHPRNFLPNDPYSGPFLTSSASSYGSDEEDLVSTYSHHLSF